MPTPFDQLWRREDPEAGSPLPPATSSNWLATGTFAVGAALAGTSLPDGTILSLFGAVYGAGLAATAWMVRPRKKRRRVFSLLMVPILLQAAVYVLYAYPVAAAAITGDDHLTDPRFHESIGTVALAAFLTGWAPSLFLYMYARQGRLLLMVQAIAPAAGFLVYVLAYLVP